MAYKQTAAVWTLIQVSRVTVGEDFLMLVIVVFNEPKLPNCQRFDQFTSTIEALFTKVAREPYYTRIT